MPSISAAKLEEITKAREAAVEQSRSDRLANRDLQQQARRFNDILDKITRAAKGQPLVEDQNGALFHGGSMGFGSGLDHSRLTDAERTAIEQDQLRERIVNLESRLAAVVAVSQFAKVHKA